MEAYLSFQCLVLCENPQETMFVSTSIYVFFSCRLSNSGMFIGDVTVYQNHTTYIHYQMFFDANIGFSLLDLDQLIGFFLSNLQVLQTPHNA